MKYKNIMLVLFIALLIAFNFWLAYVQWIPFSPIEGAIYILTFISYLLIICLGYMLLTHLTLSIKSQRKSTVVFYLSSVISVVLLIGVILFNSVMHTGFIKGIALSENKFGDKTFYLYETGFVDSIIEIREKHPYLPISTYIYYVNGYQSKVSLEVIDNIVYLVHRDRKTKRIQSKLKIYDLKTKKYYTNSYA